MRIPAAFKLLGRSYTVEVIASKDWPDGDAVAFFEADACRICIRKDTKEFMEHSFLHELTHAVLNAMGRNKLFLDEAFVDNLSGLFHQAFTSAEYGKRE